MKRVPKESSIQAACIRYLKTLEKCAWIKIHGGPFQGKAFDLMIVVQGDPFVIELKRPGNKLTDAQAHTLKVWEEAGAVAARVESVDQLRELIAERTRRLPCV
ncbi:MAG: hypothetical protein GXY38_14305 [Planctomycetes bacterium]|nr:hypothetical protein [Planctomycetota bacterium]